MSYCPDCGLPVRPTPENRAIHETCRPKAAMPKARLGDIIEFTHTAHKSREFEMYESSLGHVIDLALRGESNVRHTRTIWVEDPVRWPEAFHSVGAVMGIRTCYEGEIVNYPYEDEFGRYLDRSRQVRLYLVAYDLMHTALVPMRRVVKVHKQDCIMWPIDHMMKNVRRRNHANIINERRIANLGLSRDGSHTEQGDREVRSEGLPSDRAELL